MTGSCQFGWFSTGRDKAARELLTVVKSAIERADIEAEIAFVFCSREPGESAESDLFIKLVADYNIPLVCFSYHKFKSGSQTKSRHDLRLDYDREVMKRLRGFTPDLCVLAGYMLIIGEELCRQYNMINLHPAAPGGPAGTWQEVIWQLIRSRAKETGVMMHLVTPELDKGPVVTYCTFPVRGEPFDRHWQAIDRWSIEEVQEKEGENNLLFQAIRRHGLAREFPLITATLKAFSRGKIRITADKRVVDASGETIDGYNLTGEIDARVKGVIP